MSLSFQFDLSNNETHAVSRNFIQYAVSFLTVISADFVQASYNTLCNPSQIQKIPGTNVFLGVIRKTREIIPFSCFCTKVCIYGGDLF